MERIDQLIMEGNSPTIGQEEFMRIISDDLQCSIEQVRRIKLLPNGEVGIYDFSLPKSSKNFINTKCLNRESMPEWIKEKIAVLQICEAGEQIDGVGQKVSESTYYVIE